MYVEVEISFVDVVYVEVYGIGIKVGDLEELSIIMSVFCNGWNLEMDFLLIGFVKFNIGYFEFVLGLCGVVKVLFVM